MTPLLKTDIWLFTTKSSAPLPGPLPTPAAKSRLFLLDDQPLVISSIHSLFIRANDPTLVIGLATTTALDRVTLQPNDLILVGFGMIGLSNNDDLLNFRRSHPQARFGIFATQDDPDLARTARQLGSVGFVSKRKPTSTILSEIQRMLNPVPTAVPWPTVPSDPGRRNPNNTVTPRQSDVLRLLAQGLSNKEIAIKLDIAEVTVKIHLRHAYRTLGVQNRIGAVRKVFEHLPSPEYQIRP